MHMLSYLLEEYYFQPEQKFSCRRNLLYLQVWSEQMQKAGYQCPAFSSLADAGISGLRQRFEAVLNALYPDTEINENFLVQTALEEYRRGCFDSAVDFVHHKRYIAEKFHYQGKTETSAECFLNQLPLLMDFLQFAEKNQWHIAENQENMPLPEFAAQNHAVLESWRMFIHYFSCCSSPDNTAWLFTHQDYRNQNAFAWNEAEQISLASAGTVSELHEIRDFWKQHFPIAFCTAGEYICYAVKLATGEIMRCTAPEFEEPQTAAASFPEFVQKIITGGLVMGKYPERRSA